MATLTHLVPLTPDQIRLIAASLVATSRSGGLTAGWVLALRVLEAGQQDLDDDLVGKLLTHVIQEYHAEIRERI